MTLLYPAMLWSLAALVPLAAFYFLKVRPRRKPTTAFFLWEKVWEERRSSSLFRRLRDFWSLLLMALAAAAISLALTQPEWKDRRQDLLLLIDNSASMSAKQDRASRLEQAKAMAANIVEGLNGTQRAAVATVAQKLVYRSHLTDNPRELLDAINAIGPSCQELRLDVLPTENDRHHQYARDHRVLFISDGSRKVEKTSPTTSTPKQPGLPQHIELIKVGDAVENVGIVAADMAYQPGRPNQLAFYYQVASTYETPQELDLVIARLDEQGNEQVGRILPLEIAPGVNPPETFNLDDALPGKWIARLDVKDALPSDNTAYLVARRPKPIRIAVRSNDPFFLENSVLAFSQDDSLLELVQEKPDLILTNQTPPDDSTSKFILFQPTGDSFWWQELGETILVGAPRLQTENHPALRYLDATSIPYIGAKQITAAPGAQVLVTDERGIPLIYKARNGKQEGIIVNMDPLASDFYFSAWFPVLVHSASSHLAGRENPLAATYRPGETVPVPGVSEEQNSKWKNVAGKETKISGRHATLEDQLGYSELTNDSGQWFLGASLLSESETMLNNKDATSTNEAISRGRSPTQWLTLLAIVVLVGESVLYHRRKVG